MTTSLPMLVALAILIAIPHQARAARLLTREQAENIAAQSIQMTGESGDPLSKIKDYFLFSVLSGRGKTASSSQGPPERWMEARLRVR